MPALCDLTQDIPVTFHNFGHNSGKIDYIFASPELTAESIYCWTDEMHGIYLSDRYPLCALIKL